MKIACCAAGTVLLGVRWAPLELPLARRLQTLVVALWIHTLYLGPSIVWLVLVAVWLVPALRWVALLYAAWVYLDYNTCEQGGRRGGKWPSRYRHPSKSN